MSTNYYYRETRNGKEKHIGQRYAAGLYCYNCRVQVKGDCPACGAKVATEENPMTKDNLCVLPTMGFCWAVNSSDVESIPYVEDEYGKIMSGNDFWQMIRECKVHDYNSIGKEFS